MDIALSVVTDIVSKLVDTAIRQARYSFQFNKYVNDLEKEKANLQLKIESTIGRAQEAKKKTEKTVSVVDDWLSKADSLMAQVLEMEEKANKRNKVSCLKCCPNWVSRYGLAKKIEEKINEIIEHKEKDFPEFSRLATLIGMNYFSSEAFVHFNSRKVACDGLLEALKNDKVRMIGLWGMGGCGKTTLVKEVSKEAEKFFDKVVFVTVSNTIQVRNIQGKTASQLGLKLEEEEETERARRLFMRLNGGERFLIILDDVWEMLDFEAIGIPVGENKNGCTVLITTRELRVCTLMNCQSIIGLEILNMEEALTLFQKHAKLFDENSETKKLKVLAENITKECGGLPVAIAAVASSLRGKTQAEWVEALETLRDCSPVDIGEGLKNPYTCLRLSYDNLKNEVAKSLFLLCSVFPEDYEIDIDDLAIFGIALGLIGEIHSLKRARNQVSISINKLVDSCLLLGDKEKGVISMHDLVRDVALWIAKNENKMIMGPERSQKVLKVDMILKDNSIRYLWLEGVDKFPHELDCPNLEFLRISIKSKHGKYVANEFLNGLKKLRVLFLEHQSSDKEQVLELPESIHSINNLRYLLLDGWILGDISLLGGLERLVSLTLRYCSFDELPKSISEQKNLRLLHISDCEIKRNPYEVIGRCSQLEELYFYDNSGEEWEDKGENVVEFFDKNCSTLALERYIVVIGKLYYEEVRSTITRVVSVGDFESCISNETIRDLMQRAHSLSLERIHSCKTIVPDIVERIGGDMNELTVLELYDSDEIEYVIDIPNHSALGLVRIISNLTQLEISGLKNLKTLCNGRPPHGLFANLEILMVRECNSLEHIITDEVEEIVEDDNEYQRNYTLAFPNLKLIDIIECNQLEYIVPISYTLSLPKLNVLTIDGAAKLKNIFGQCNYKDQNPNEFQSIELLALRELTLYDLPNIISICAENYHPRWPSLERLYLRNCPQLTTMSVSNHSIPHSGLTQQHTAAKDGKEIHMEKLKEIVLVGFNIDVLFYVEGPEMNSVLQRLRLEDLHELRHIWIGPKNVLQLQNLGILTITKCEILKVVFPATISRSLPQLRKLIIMDCKELVEIIEEEENQNVSIPQLVFPNIGTIIIRHCPKLKRVFPVCTSRALPKLKALYIEEASQLEQVFGNEAQEKMEGVMIPNLEYVVLMKLPRLKMGPQWIGLQTVRYRLVQDSQYINFTSTVATLEELRKICKTEIDDEYDEDVWELKYNLKKIIQSNEDSSEEITKQIESKGTHGVEAASEIVDISSQVETNQNNSGTQLEQKLTPNQNKATKECTGEMPGLEPVVMTTSSTNPLELVDEISTSKPSLVGQKQPLAENEIPLATKSVNKLEEPSVEEGNISENKSVKRFTEGSILKNAEIVTSSAPSEPTSLFPSPLVTTFSKAVLIQRQIKVNQTEVNIDKDIEAKPSINLEDNDLISLFQFQEEEDGGQLSIPSIPIVAAIGNDLVGKALADLEVSLKMPLKDIATSEDNSLRVLTTLNFLSRLSVEDGALLPQGLKGIIKSLHQELPSILYSFKPALAMINKFHEAQEKEARLMDQISMWEKEIEDCEAKLSSLQEQKKTCVAEATEFNKEYESVMKENVEMVEDQRKAWQKLFDVDYKWSILYSQFQKNNIDVHTRRIIHSTFENVIENKEDSGFQNLALVAAPNLTESLNETTIGLEIPAAMETSHETELVDRRSAIEPSLTDQQQPLGEFETANNEFSHETKSDITVEDEDQSAKEGNISEETSIVKGNIEEGSSSKNAEALPHSQLNINQSVAIAGTTKDELVRKAISDMEVSLKMPLKDIATSKANSLRLLTALNFLSCLSWDEGALPHGLKAIIDSLHQDLPSILCSFKSSFAKINKFPKLKEHISKLENEIKDCDKKLLSVEEKKKKYVAETVELKKEFESVRKDKSEIMEEHQRKAQQHIFQDNYRWSFLCSQFQLNNIDARILDWRRRRRRRSVQALCSNCIETLKQIASSVVAEIVSKLVDEAYSLMERVVELEENAKKRRKKSCLKYCPNWIRRYGLAKQLEEKISEIAKECCGLPVAIAAVASTLKNKTHDEWTEALETL
ncbi:Disease resistance protein [Senna tora]|uniref:Disease resistance protein n=1 Tax=Senna tora TaxID=362788 RepID=A0A834WVS0_9FABA|nr:Disease resistance protein [Senna tora]